MTSTSCFSFVLTVNMEDQILIATFAFILVIIATNAGVAEYVCHGDKALVSLIPNRNNVTAKFTVYMTGIISL